jgi:ring-1,2-phenylacetyl-CoA epoxidase subunit PaaE
MSTIRTTLETEPRSRFTLLYGNRTTASTMFADELAGLERQYGDRLLIHRLLSREEGAPLSGRVGPEAVARLVPDRSAVATWFLCGPEEMVDKIGAALAGVSLPEQVLSEIFHPTTKETTQVDVDILSEVIVSLDGVETTFELRSTAESIRDAALQRGIDPPYSCAGGACGTCKARVLLGRAVMDQNHVLDAGEVARGYVLTCQAHPVTAEVRVEYDA